MIVGDEDDLDALLEACGSKIEGPFFASSEDTVTAPSRAPVMSQDLWDRATVPVNPGGGETGGIHRQALVAKQ